MKKGKEIIERAMVAYREKLIVDAHHAGYNYSQIAFIFKTSHVSIMRIVKQYAKRAE